LQLPQRLAEKTASGRAGRAKAEQQGFPISRNVDGKAEGKGKESYYDMTTPAVATREKTILSLIFHWMSLRPSVKYDERL